MDLDIGFIVAAVLAVGTVVTLARAAAQRFDETASGLDDRPMVRHHQRAA